MGFVAPWHMGSSWIESVSLALQVDSSPVDHQGSPALSLLAFKHYQVDGHEFEQALGVSDGQGSLVYSAVPSVYLLI